MRKHGCEIEAKALSYSIRTDQQKQSQQQQQQLFKKIWNSSESSSPPPGVRHVLNNVSCRAKPWEILAVVGPSGAGKSTLLEVLAGRLPLPPPPASILVDGLPLSKRSFRRISAFVPQKDCLFPLLSVAETLAFTARLRLGLSSAPLQPRVDALLSELGLSPVAASRVSSISGGERRRVSIAIEVVHDPAVLILDEPTSGLDSTSALQIVDMLRSMAEARGRTVVLSIHQPCSRIVKLFGSVLLLADGTVLHQGTVAELVSRLAAAGHPLPPHANPLELAIASVDSLSQLQRNNHKTDQHSTLQQLFHINNDNNNHHPQFDYANNRLFETAILTQRFMKNVARTKELFTCRTFQIFLSGLVLGSIFFNLTLDVPGARDRVGLFAFILTFLFSSTTEGLPIFLKEREILIKETSCGCYRVSSYVIANGLVFLPFLFVLALLFAVPLYWLSGLDRRLSSFAFFLLLIWLILYTANSVVVCFSALAPNFIVGNSVIAGVMGSFFLFSGYFIRKEGMPGCWVFMNYLSLFRYPFEAFLVNEFSCKGKCKCLEERFGICVLDGEQLLNKEGLGSVSRWKNVLVMLGFIFGYRFGSYIILRLRSKCVQRGGLKTAFFNF